MKENMPVYAVTYSYKRNGTEGVWKCGAYDVAEAKKKFRAIFGKWRKVEKAFKVS